MKNTLAILFMFFIWTLSFAKESNKINVNNETVTTIIIEINFDETKKRYYHKEEIKNNSSKLDIDSFSNIINKEIVKFSFDECTLKVTVRVGVTTANFIEVSLTRKVDCEIWMEELKRLKEEIKKQISEM